MHVQLYKLDAVLSVISLFLDVIFNDTSDPLPLCYEGSSPSLLLRLLSLSAMNAPLPLCYECFSPSTVKAPLPLCYECSSPSTVKAPLSLSQL